MNESLIKFRRHDTNSTETKKEKNIIKRILRNNKYENEYVKVHLIK